jgi:hypothetical protein
MAGRTRAYIYRKWCSYSSWNLHSCGMPRINEYACMESTNRNNLNIESMEGMEATFILKDVIYIVVGVASALGFYWKMVMSDKSQEEKIKHNQKDIQKNESVMFKKVAGIPSRMEKNEEKNKT